VVLLLVGEPPALATVDAARVPRELPFAPMTRWQGTTMPTGLAPLARPTARKSDGVATLPRDLAVGTRLAGGIQRKACRTAR
jgi:hypothetical protein